MHLKTKCIMHMEENICSAIFFLDDEVLNYKNVFFVDATVLFKNLSSQMRSILTVDFPRSSIFFF